MITTREIVDRLKDIYEKLAGVASFRWGVVTSVDPPLVRLDADTNPVIVGTITPLTVGSRVLVLLQNRKNTVVGSSGGDPNIIIGGTAYQASGSVVLPEVALTILATGTGYATINVTLPYALPTGWTYALTVDRNPMAWPITVNNADGTNTATQRIRLSAPSGAKITAGARIGWRITKL